MVSSSEAGFGLISILTFVSLLGLATLSGASMVAHRTQMMGLSRVVQARDLVEMRVRRAVSMRQSYLQTLRSPTVDQENPELKACLINDDFSASPANDCHALNSDGTPRVHPLLLYSPSGEDVVAGSATLAGFTRYDRSGALCAAGATVNCDYEVDASFTATCAGGAAACPQADTVEVTYRIRPSAAFLDSRQGIVATLSGKWKFDPVYGGMNPMVPTPPASPTPTPSPTPSAAPDTSTVAAAALLLASSAPSAVPTASEPAPTAAAAPAAAAAAAPAAGAPASAPVIAPTPAPTVPPEVVRVMCPAGMAVAGPYCVKVSHGR